MYFERLKNWIQRIEYLLLDEDFLSLSIKVYGKQKGLWNGQRTSDGIWPINFSAPHAKPWSDFQMEVYEDMCLRLKALRLEIVQQAEIFLPR